MPGKMPKYKLSGIFVIILIMVVIVGCLYFNYWYLKSPATVMVNPVKLEVEEADIQTIDNVKTKLVESEEYKLLVPADLPEDFNSGALGKTNPFDVNMNE